MTSPLPENDKQPETQVENKLQERKRPSDPTFRADC